VTDALVTEGIALVESAEEAGATLRLLGGVAVVLHSSGTLHRELGDLDAVTTAKDVATLTRVLEGRGYVPEPRFNALHGERRLIFYGPAGKVDVFVDTFEMCHRIELKDRLRLDSPTITATDLLLTKLQVVELNAKDTDDVAELFRHHELGAGEGDRFDEDYLERLVADDWGLWRTATGTLDRVAELRPDVAEPALRLRRTLDEAPKGRKFRLRARVGERVRWYEPPDEVE
jgi:hypothetical protein